MGSFRRNSAWQLVQSVSSTGTDLLVILAFSAKLGAEEFGRLTVLLSFAKIVFLLFEPRIHEYLIPRLVRAGSRSARGVWTWTRVGVSVEFAANLCALAACLVIYFFVPDVLGRLVGDASLFPYAVAFVLTSTLLKFSSISVFRALGKVKTSALLSSATGLAKLTALAVTLFAFGSGTLLTLIVLSAVSLVAAVVQAGVARWELRARFGRAPKRKARSLRRANVRATSRQMLANYSVGLLEIAYREMDVQLLAAMADATEAGRYKIAKNLAMILMELLGPVVMMSLPEFSARVATQRWDQVVSFARRAAKLLAILAAATALPMFFLVPILIKQFLPAQIESLPTFAILLASFVLCAPLLWSQSLLVALSSVHRYVGASAIGAVTSFVMAIALVPLLGARGSAIAFGAGLLTVSSIASYLSLTIVGEAGLRAREKRR